MSEWWTHGYPGHPMVKVAGFPRPLYPPDAAEKGKKPSADGPDVVAYKRTVSRAGRWPWQTFDDSYSNRFAHGASGNVIDTGIAGVQRQQGIDPTGWVGEKTFNTLRSIVVPDGLPHAGEPAMDATAARLVDDAYELFGGREPADETSAEDSVRGRLTEFAEIGLANPSRWTYALVRPLDVSVDPAGPVTSDCSMSAIQMFHWARDKSGVNIPDPSKQNYSGYGNTEYYEDEHPRVTNGSYLVGDLAHYGYGGSESTHVTVCIVAGGADSADWWSFGSEPPSRRKLYYRSDFLFVVRPPLIS